MAIWEWSLFFGVVKFQSYGENTEWLTSAAISLFRSSFIARQ